MKYHTIWVTYNLKVKIYVEKKKNYLACAARLECVQMSKNVILQHMAPFKMWFLQHKGALNGRFKTWFIKMSYKYSRKNNFAKYKFNLNTLPACNEQKCAFYSSEKYGGLYYQKTRPEIRILFQKENTEPEVFMIQ